MSASGDIQYRVLITFWVPGLPVPQGSHVPFISKTTGRACVKPPGGQKLGQWRAVVRMAAANAWASRPLVPKSEPVHLDVCFFFIHPPSHYRTRTNSGKLSTRAPIYPHYPDRDKLLRAIQDGLTGVIYEDDGQVCDGRTAKRYSDKPGAQISVAVREGSELLREIVG